MLFCPILINSLCVTVSFIMHMNDFTSIALRECDTSVFIIISKLHHSTIWKLLMNNTKSSVIGILNRCDMTGIFHFRDSSIFPIGIAVFCTGCRCHLFEFSFPVCKLHDPSGMVGHFFKLSFFIIRVGQAAPIVCLRFFKFSIFEIGKRYAPSIPVFFPEHLSVLVKRYDLRARMFKHVSCFRFF